MPIGKKTYLPIIAITLILIGTISSAYVYSTEVNSEKITINNQEYTIDQLNLITDTKTIEMDQIEKTGLALDDLIIKTNIENPYNHLYTITGSDGYSKTVTWANMQNGILTEEKNVYFSDLPKAFRIKNIIKIEVLIYE